MKGNIKMNNPLKLYYCYKINVLNKKINSVYMDYANRSSRSSRNFEFYHLVDQDENVILYKKEIYRLKRRMCELN